MSNLIIPNDVATKLRKIAASLELYQTRGSAAYREGNIKELLVLFVGAYECDEKQGHAMLDQFLFCQHCMLAKNECICK